MAKPGWSELPIDLLINVLDLLQLPEALAFRAVCPLWRSASMAAAGLPRTRRTPWLVSLVTDPGEEQQSRPSFSSKFRSLLDETKTYQVSLPRRGKAVALCGASHGWLVVANELSDLVLYDPFAMTTIPLPPITAFSKCIRVVYDRHDHRLKGYHYLFHLGGLIHDVVSTARYFYDKVVLSGAPSTGGAVSLAVHVEGTRLSFAKVGGASWQQVAVVKTGGDCFADIVHHRGRFYAVTMKGMLLSFNYCGLIKPKRETIIAEHDDDNLSHVITRYLVSTPWGHLLQVRVILVLDWNQENYVKVEISRLDFRSRRMVGLNPTEALRGHIVFLGQNSPGVLSTREFPELRQNCIYFTTPRLRNEVTYRSRYNRWSGVKVYDLQKQTLEVAFLSDRGYYGPIHLLQVWF